MSQPMPEPEDLRVHKGKIWTYLILMGLLIVIVVVINAVWKEPSLAQSGVKTFFGLPSWALTSVVMAVGALIFWLGLKVEADWPEALGAFLIGGAVTSFEYIIGWHHFELGLVVVPYLIPIVVFVVLLGVGIKYSV